MNGLLWTLIPFGVLLLATVILCVFHKKQNGNGWSRIPAMLGLLLCHAYFWIGLLVWGYIGTASLIGWGWGAALYGLFWLSPWLGGLMPIKPMLMAILDGSMSFERVRLTGHGFMTDKGVFGETCFWMAGKDERAVMADIVKQINPQLKEQIKNPIRRWLMFHWRWYAPLTGGYASFDQAFAHNIDDIIHNTYGHPITRYGRSGPLAGIGIVEINV